nr:ribosomal protein L34 [Cryptomonas sp. NIES-345]BDA98360.1 ribosomal protein L34 [Cryptomonas sp. NIES-1327]
MTKRTLRGTKIKRLRTSGFRSRIKTTAGRRILKSRRTRERHAISIK